jgi:ribonuclease J
MIKLTFYGGVNEIGGNKILLEHKDTKIFLDFGWSFTMGKDPFSEEDIEAEVMQNWIKHFKLKFYQLHASGHASREEIMEITKSIGPQKVIPMHTEHPKLFKKLLKSKVIEPKVGENIFI